MINKLTIPHNPTEPSDLQMLHDFLSYHMDMEPRKVTVISGEGWKFQYEGEDEIEMSTNLVIDIPAMKSHKIIKGSTDLVVTIEIG